jgi:hypothetical protein
MDPSLGWLTPITTVLVAATSNHHFTLILNCYVCNYCPPSWDEVCTIQAKFIWVDTWNLCSYMSIYYYIQRAIIYLYEILKRNCLAGKKQCRRVSHNTLLLLSIGFSYSIVVSAALVVSWL